MDKEIVVIFEINNFKIKTTKLGSRINNLELLHLLDYDFWREEKQFMMVETDKSFEMIDSMGIVYSDGSKETISYGYATTNTY